jgi:hypothetical protein
MKVPPFSRRPSSAFLSVVILGLLGAGCGTETITEVHVPFQAERRELLLARAKWRAAGLVSYTYVIRHPCPCPAEYQNPTRVTVVNGAITSIEPVGDSLGRIGPYTTIEGQFDRLLRMIDLPVATYRVRYDEALGFPAGAFVDPRADLFDDEYLFIATDLEPLR